jgi:hypothetical protein
MFIAVLPRLVLTLTFGQPDPAVAPSSDAAAALHRCDELLAKGPPAPARACFEEVRSRYPGTPEAHDADRALMLTGAITPPAAPAVSPPSPKITTEQPKENFYVLEPYSTRTKERLRLNTWEKLDFGITAFIYGLSAGASFGGATDSTNIVAPMVVGSLTYTGLAVLYVNMADIDRGDLPLVLAISSYIPLTAGLVTLTTNSNSPRAAGSLIGLSGLIALPIAYWAAANTNLDPGDTQLVRDSGFWGAVLGVTSALSTSNNPSERTVGIAGLVGLYGGLGLGLLAASHSDLSLERVRVTTWGGYGGAILGGLIAAAGNTSTSDGFRDVAIGSALGLVVTFISTSSIDAAPDNAHFDEAHPLSFRYLEPALLPLVARDGRTQPRPGINLVRGRF